MNRLISMTAGWVLALALIPTPILSQEPGEESGIKPTWETQKQARTYLMGIPAPRGLITDRNGKPLAQTRIGHNLAINFPTPLTFSDAQALAYAHKMITTAETLLARRITISTTQITKHYRNRGLLPLEIVRDLLPAELNAIRGRLPEGLELRPVYVRFYPNGSLAGHILGYVGKMGRNQTGPIKNNELLWPDFEGREGIEQTFNSQLTGHHGQMNLSFDAQGNQSSEVIAIQPEPGNNVVMTIDENIQRKAEKILTESCERGAMVIIEPSSGDILAMASHPVYNPNTFIPFISTAQYKALQDNPDVPLLPRAYRAAYPPGSTYKMVTGLAALQSGTITTSQEFECPTSIRVGGLTFRNWKKDHAGSLTFAEALTQSCNTWFYQVGIETGAEPMVEWAHKLGFGEKSGIPLRSEIVGRVPTDDYMRKIYNRPLMDGDLANVSIGQGDVLVTPLQMAQAMAVIANGGTFYQTRLVSQVQDHNNRIITAYDIRAKAQLDISPRVIAQLHQGMVNVVSSSMGTAARARIDDIKVAGKTGTAQWGPKHKERTAAWFVGFAPAENAKYAFACLYEGEANDSSVHGGSHAAPMIGKVLKELFAEEKEQQKELEEERKKAEIESESGESAIPRAEPVNPDAL